jgi:hypothetical protein
MPDMRSFSTTHHSLSSIKDIKTPSLNTGQRKKQFPGFLTSGTVDTKTREILSSCKGIVSNTVQQHFIRVTPIHVFGFITHPHMKADTHNGEY